MAADFWLSIGLGGGLGLLYGFAAHLFNQRALAAGHERFLEIVLGGLVIRMFGFLAAVLVVLMTTPVREGVFVGSFLTVIVAATIFEIYRLDRGRRTSG